MKIKKLAGQYESYIIEKRRYFHQHPELSFKEFNTTQVLKEELEEMGIEVTSFADYNGLIGTINPQKAGPTIMLRADIDALPVEEHTDLPYASSNPGVMHACGHDTHIAMLLGAAKILSEIKEELPGQVKLLFQAAEECCYGSKYYIEHGCLNGVDAIFGMHIWGTLEAPYFSLREGGCMSSCSNFKIKVKGSSAHGSAPHMGHDAIVAAASVIMNLQTFVSRRNDPLNALVVTIGTISGGQAFNILANEVILEGTVRTYSRELTKTIETEMKQIIDGSAAALGCSADFTFQHYLNPIINDDKKLNRLARNAAVKLYGEDCLKDMEPLMSSDDFANFTDIIPGFYGYVGSRNETLGTTYPNHNDKYDIDETVLAKGAALYAQFAYDFLHE